MVNCFYIVVRSMPVESGLPSEKELRDSGLECGSRKANSEPVEWFRRLLGDPLGKESRAESETKRPGSMYLVEGLPPLPRRKVDRIKEGEFLEFTDFPVFDGVLPVPTQEVRYKKPDGCHAVMAVDYSDERNTFLILNSYGPEWGEDGYFYMPYEFITDPDLYQLLDNNF